MIDRRGLLIAGIATGLAPAAHARATEVRVAVAANFTATAKALAARFEARTGHRVIQSFGASGQFYAQIVHGAPFEVFLSADAERPQRLEKEGHGLGGTRFTYARGALVLWSADRTRDVHADLIAGRFHKLALADPATAPYGLAAEETLRHMGLYARTAPKLVKGSSIAQAYSFVATGAAELGFVARAQVQSAKGAKWAVPQDHHAPLDQQAVLLKDTPAARAYHAYLRTPETARLIRAHGYEVG